MAEKAAEMSGAIPQDAATCETLPLVQSQVTLACEAIPAPTSAPTTVCVVDTGKPALVATSNQVALPTSVHPMTSMRTPGLGVKRSRSIMSFLMVPVTRDPRATAPTNSVTMERKPTWTIVRERAATEVA